MELAESLRRLVRAAARPLSHMNQSPQSRIDGLLVGEILSDIGRDEYKICSCPIARDIFAADAAFQFGQVVLPT